ncbi:Small secreted domain [Streptomyces misionensis]|uniref:Small secreted domain n=1 Tax=Streptomyces misionensis TaxID=67331 RepID=A0A1H4PSH4_9ACTN|nr:Small secreted domain [Streptomyces misionensis]
MRRATRNGVIAAVAASGAMALAWPASAAFAADGASADGVAAGSPGLISGNGIQLPVDVPVNVCGNTVDVVGLLNPTAGNTCANNAGGARGGSSTSGGATAHGTAAHSPGVISGNGVQLPVDLPVNISGNSVNVVGLLNPAMGNTSVNGGGETPRHPVTPTPEPPAPVRHHPAPHTPRPAPEPVAGTLAHTGADLTAPAAAASAALLLTGTILYRRCRPARGR